MLASVLALLTFACDVSYFQHLADDSYPHPWLIFRAADGTFIDPNCAANYRWAKAAARAGKLVGYTAYIVYEPGVDLLAQLKKALGNKPDEFLTVMIDVERWGGKITGNHSPEINREADRIAAWLGDRKRVLVYANSGDFAALFPKRDRWLHLILADYTAVPPHLQHVLAHAIGWQYTDGSGNYPAPDGYPTSSAPFGHCDHNVFPNHTPTQLAAALGVGTNGATMSITDGDAKTLFAHKLTSHGQTQTVAAWIANGCRNARLTLDGINDVKKALLTKTTGVLDMLGAVKADLAKLTSDVAAVQAAVAKVDADVTAIRAGQLEPITVPLNGSIVIGGAK